MPRPSKGARLYRRSRNGKSAWVILDTGGIEISTGTDNRRQAEISLSQYIQSKSRRGPASAEQLTVAEILSVYGTEHAAHVAAPERIGYAIGPLLEYFGDSPASFVTAATCRRYSAERGRSHGTIRRELGTLRAALNFAAREGYLTRAPTVVLPPKPPPKDRWLTRDEAAKLLWAARKNAPHLCRFILVGLYTGTRKQAILALRFEPHPGGGYIDTKRGVMHRRSAGETETNKRRPPVRLPRKLLAHAKRWERSGGWVVAFHGNRVGDIKTSWQNATAGMTDVTPHTLRHTAITWAMQAGVPLADVAGFFGASVEVIETTYFHHHPEFQVETAKALDSWRG